MTFEKLLIIGVIAAFIIGPDRLPAAAEKLRELVRWARGATSDAKERMREEMGEEFDEVDWRKLDPRQYDPRRIIRDALLEEEPAGAAGVIAGAGSSRAAGSGSSRPAWAEQAAAGRDEPAPYDPEAT